jgi:hypothetical protein
MFNVRECRAIKKGISTSSLDHPVIIIMSLNRDCIARPLYCPHGHYSNNGALHFILFVITITEL